MDFLAKFGAENFGTKFLQTQKRTIRNQKPGKSPSKSRE